MAPLRAFTLLEILIALSIFVMIMTGIFAIAKGSMELSEDLKSSQERAMTRQNFIEFLRSSFRRIPGDGEIQLSVQNVRGTYMPSIHVFNGGDAFSPGDALPPEGSVELYAADTPSGYMRVGLRLFDDQQTNAIRQDPKRRKPVSKDDNILPLIDQVGKFEWKFYDPATQRWENTWKGPGRPLFAEVLFALDDRIETRCVFWIPPIMKRPANGIPGGGLNPTPNLGPDGQPLPPGPVPPQLNPNANPNAPPQLVPQQ